MTVRRYYIILLLTALFVAGCATGRDQQATKHNPASYHYQMGLSYLGERNYTSALVELTEAEKLDPDNPELLYNLGMAYMGKKRPDLAEQKIEKAVKLKQDYSVARNDLGVIYLELKRWDSAIQQFTVVKGDMLYDNNAEAAINLGLAYFGKGDYPKAFEELRAVLAANPRNPTKVVVHLSLGRVWFAMDKPEQAIGEYRKALEIYKDYAAAYYHLGLAYLKLNNQEAARSAFKEVLRIIPDSDLGHLSLGYLELL
jgi:Tfp pilus assembly protein PilF